MAKDPVRDQSLRDSLTAQHEAKVGFFYRGSKIFNSLIKIADNLNWRKYNWDNLIQWGVSEASWSVIMQKRLSPCKVFSHPKVIQSYPNLVTYYRCLAILSRKAVAEIIFDPTPFEKGKRAFRSEQAIQFSRIVNSNVSKLVEAEPSLSIESLRMGALMNYGAEINGSWRNEIGAKAATRIQELLTNYFFRAGFITYLLDQSLNIQPLPPQLPLPSNKGFVTKNGYSMTFGTEPDISIKDPKKRIVTAIEVKGGLDPAGALERYGAALKSHRKILEENPSALTIYLAACITDAVQSRLTNEAVVKRSFNLSHILATGRSEQSEFFSLVKELMELN